MLKPMDTRGLKTYPISRRKSLVHVKDFAAAVESGPGIAKFLSSFPNIYAGRDLKELIHVLVRAYRRKKCVAVALGGHVVKCGLNPLLIDLIERGVIRAVALNGGAAIHDLEIGLIGRTSEDVAESLPDGRFGMARETAEAFATAASMGAKGKGLGRALGEHIFAGRHPYARLSLLATCAKKNIPATVHVAIGAEITHMHSNLSGADLGEASLIDFRILTSVVARLEGGVWMNIGSAVILPEVFLKAVSIVRNLGHRLREFTTVNLDMFQHYRPKANVLARPRGRAIAITGHHEILIPLIRAGVISALKGNSIR